ncbi:MAG: citrate lyase subunit alpha, partial [Pseudomonadota bacterium]
MSPPLRGAPKLAASLAEAVARAGLRDGATVSFHHHLRNGDAVMAAVLSALSAAGLKGLRFAPSSLFPVHASLASFVEDGTIGAIETAFITGPFTEVAAAAAASGQLPPIRLSTHGGRAAAIRDGSLRIDAAFVAAPAADADGNATGTLGPNACGALGYPMVDVRHAGHTVIVTDHLVPYPCLPAIIGAEDVDTVVVVPSIGDADGILSGTTQQATDPADQALAKRAAALVAASGLLVDGFSFQTGAGGISLATAEAVGQLMAERGVSGSFASGGITALLVRLHEAGLFRALLDVQCFDLDAVQSLARNPDHQVISAAAYAAPGPRRAVVDRLDAVILGAAEVDRAFNVNVTRAADGRIIGGSGGHADTAAGARLAIVTTRLTARGFAKIVERCGSITTPGGSIDAVVTEAGIAVHPARPELADRARAAGLPLTSIDDLARAASA